MHSPAREWLTALPPHNLSGNGGVPLPPARQPICMENTAALCKGDFPGCGCLIAPRGRGGGRGVSARRTSALASEMPRSWLLPWTLWTMSGGLALHGSSSGPPSQPPAQGWWTGFLQDHSKSLGPWERVRREQQCLPSAGVRAFSSQCLLSFYCLI